MRKISLKVFFSTMIAMFLASLIPHTIMFLMKEDHYTFEERYEVTDMALMFFMYFILVLVFNFFMNKIITKRLKKLNEATTQVIQGNYEIRIQDNKKDEISDVMTHFNKMVEELKANAYLNKEFVQNFAHELKTPLSIVKGYAELLNDNELTDSERSEYVDIINKEVIRLTDLSKNMLTISLVDSQSIIKSNDCFDVAKQIREIIRKSHFSWEKKNLILDIQLESITVYSNKEFLYHVWENLFSNAVKFSSEGSQITIELKVKENEIVFSITNEGMLDVEECNNVFDLFYIGNKSRNNHSSGIGLTLTKKIIEKLGGSISVSSNDNTITFQTHIPQ